MSVHERLKCPRCQRVPQHINVIEHLNTGVDLVSTYCLHCGRQYRWRVLSSDTARVLLCDERPMNPVRLKYLRRKEGDKDAYDTHPPR